MLSMDRACIHDTVNVGDVAVHFVDSDALSKWNGDGGQSGRGGGAAGGRGPVLMTKWKGVEVYDVDVDELLGPSYESVARRPLRDWADNPAEDAAELSDVVAAGDAPSPPSSSGDEDHDTPPLSPSSGRAAKGPATDGGGGSRDAEDNVQKCRQAGKGRTRGGAFDARAQLEDILVVLICRQLISTLKLRDGVDEESEKLIKWTIQALMKKRYSYPRLTNKVLSTKAWTLRRSGCIGAVVQFKDNGALDNTLQDCSLAIEVSLSDDNEVVVCCSRSAENCLETGCKQRDVVVRALKQVQSCTGMALVDVLGTLTEDLRISAMNQGIAVLYGKRLCVVRREGGSWPYAVVRRKRNGMWLCHACLQGPSSCTHAMAAREAGNNEQSEASDDEDFINSLGTRGRRRGNLVYSTEPRPLVPSQRSQKKHAMVLKAAAEGLTVNIRAAKKCPTCRSKRRSGDPVVVMQGVIEFGTGAVASAVCQWRCHKCKRACVSDGLRQGLVMCSQFTAYTEVFLFEAAVNLCRNASSLTSTYDLRAAFHQLSQEHTLPLSLDRLRSLPLFRSTVLLYIYLVIKGLPAALSTCAVCTRADGSLHTVCFDGLQLGFKLRYRTEFARISVKLDPVKRASIMAQMVSDSAVARALGSVISVATTEHESVRQAAVKTVTAVRGHVIALAVLAGDVNVEGAAVNLAGTAPHAEGRSRARGWDPLLDGGVHPALQDFIRELFRCGRAARKIALTVAGASNKLRKKVPSVLLDRVNAVIADGDNDPDSDSASSEEDAPQRPQKPDLRKYAQEIGDPSLLDAGGAAGRRRRDGALLRVIPGIPSTAATTSRLVDFLRAVVVDPVVVWAPGGDWAGVSALVQALVADKFDKRALQLAINLPQVKELRLLHGAVSALFPVLCTQPRVRDIFSNLLLALCETIQRYLKFVDDDAAACLMSTSDGRVLCATAEEMAAADPSASFHPIEYAKEWLEKPASVERFKEVYAQQADNAEDFLLTGQWAPSLPQVRPIPDFLKVAGGPDDVPECNHIMGQENQFTGGTFAGSCTCAHPKTVGVVVLDGSEGQRMPIEFIAQRMPTLPRNVVYDFSCASLKTALARLPLMAIIVNFIVDHFHWFKNHIWCSKAMNPDSYTAVDGQNTSASEERNAASRRLQNFLRLVNQRNFILFTVYQQAVGNAIAMHRDVQTPTMVERWPLWYRKQFVDLRTDGEPPTSTAADVGSKDAVAGVNAENSHQGESERDEENSEEEGVAERVDDDNLAYGSCERATTGVGGEDKVSGVDAGGEDSDEGAD